MSFYRSLFPLVKQIPPEAAHQLALMALRLPFWARRPVPSDPFEWQGLRFRNRVGIAAGLDKNGVALRGLEALGAGFVEVGTILVEPWSGNDAPTRVKRLTSVEGVWNRMGFPSIGVNAIRKNLASFPRAERNGMVIGCNIGPHPATVKGLADADDYFARVREELLHLVRALHDETDFFVVNLSSPNTPGLRGLMHRDDLPARLIAPLRQAIRGLDTQSARSIATPLLVKLPPEDAERAPWSPETLASVVNPLLESDACDGMVAVNTSTRLAMVAGEDSGGVSGRPLLPLAVEVVGMLRRVVGPDRLILGSGGVTEPGDAVKLVDAGSNLVELYTGLIYRGPSLIAECAEALRGAHADQATPIR